MHGRANDKSLVPIQETCSCWKQPEVDNLALVTEQ